MKTLDELDALHAAATAGPWEVLVTPESQFCEWRVVGPHYDDAFSDAGQSPCDDDTRDAIVALHNAWPEVSARLRAAEAKVERLRVRNQSTFERAMELAEVARHALSAGLTECEKLRAEVERLRGALRTVVDTYEALPRVTTYTWSRAAQVTATAFSDAVDAARAALGEP